MPRPTGVSSTAPDRAKHPDAVTDNVTVGEILSAQTTGVCPALE